MSSTISIAIPWPDLTLDGTKPAEDNVLGELGVRIQLSEAGEGRNAEQIAAGWRGDRYLSFKNGDSLVWKTIWGNDEQAAKFFDAERQSLEKRYHPPQSKVEGHERFEAETPRALRLLRAPDHSVVLVDSASPDLAKQLEEKFARVSK